MKGSVGSREYSIDIVLTDRKVAAVYGNIVFYSSLYGALRKKNSRAIQGKGALIFVRKINPVCKISVLCRADLAKNQDEKKKPPFHIPICWGDGN